MIIILSNYEWSHTEFNKITEEINSEIYEQYTDSAMSDQFIILVYMIFLS